MQARHQEAGQDGWEALKLHHFQMMRVLGKFNPKRAQKLSVNICGAATYQHLSSITAECRSGGPVCECCKEGIHSWVVEDLSSSAFQQKQGECLPAAGWLLP